jgi:hypothetical protein
MANRPTGVKRRTLLLDGPDTVDFYSVSEDSQPETHLVLKYSCFDTKVNPPWRGLPLVTLTCTGEGVRMEWADTTTLEVDYCQLLELHLALREWHRALKVRRIKVLK